jgi:serine/threonine protein kinase/DNA-binding XRE family transcriptional regulator
MSRAESFGRMVRERRRTLDLTQDELARRVGCAPVTIRKIEYDELRPSQQIAERLAMALAIPLDERAAFVRLARTAERPDRAGSSTPTPPLMPEEIGREDLSGRAIRGYALGERIGNGGFGAVYRAVQPLVAREVAIKIILPEYANHPDFIRRFEAEAQLVARLEHPHIVPLYDYWREPGVAYLVMRLLRGGSLHTALQAGPIPLDTVERLLEQIGAALHAAHRIGVIHRDLKPANVLLDEDGNAYLADFGIAKNLGNPNLEDQTQAGAIVGSPVYLSPEQIKSEPVTPQTDIYSLGVLLYELLTGHKPFQGSTPISLIQRHLTTPLPPLAAQRSGLPEDLDSAIERATAKQPADRYPDVLSLLADVRRILAPISSQPLVSSGRQTPDTERRTAVLELAAADNPYKGLRAFSEADATEFFGRETLTQQLLVRMGETGDLSRFLAVVGPSGSGKSSVVRAGLIPALRRGGLPTSEHWFIVEMVPGTHPLEELEAALLRIAVNPPASLLAQLREGERGLVRAVRRVLPADEAIELVLVVDQFEEVFTLVQDEAARAHLLNNLLTAVLDERSRVRLVITLRADLIDRPLQYLDFGELLRQRSEFVLPLTPDELEQAIVGPAEHAGLTLEAGLVAAIVRDVGDQPGTLPLLQYALTELFERREGRTLRLTAYQASGGVPGALARRAEEIYAKLDLASQEVARQLFLRLVTLGEGVEDTRRRVRRTELESVVSSPSPRGYLVATNHEPRTTDKVIDVYGRYRLLTFDHDPITRSPTVEVAHEALLREWGRLRGWLDASRENLRLQRRLTTAAAEWAAAGHDPSFLASGGRLAQFTALAEVGDLALNAEERAYLDGSLAEQDRQKLVERERQQRELAQAQVLAAEQQRRAETEQRRADEQSRAAARLRRRALYLATALALAVIAATIAGYLANRNATLAESNAILANNNATAQAIAETNLTTSERQRLAAEANGALDRGQSSELAALLAIRSLRIAYSPQADAALLRALTFGFARRTFTGHTDSVLTMAFSPDGRYMLTGSTDKTARLWDVASGQQVRQFVGHTIGVFGVAFSPDGKHALTGSFDKTARLWDVATGQEIRQFIGHTDAVFLVSFSPDGK